MNTRRITLIALTVLAAGFCPVSAHNNDPFGFDDFFKSINEMMSGIPTRSPHRQVVVASLAPPTAHEHDAPHTHDEHEYELDATAFAEGDKVIIQVDAPGVDKEDITVTVNRSKQYFDVHVSRITKDKKSSHGKSADGSISYRATSWVSSRQAQEKRFTFPQDLKLKGKEIEVRLKEEAKSQFDDVEVITIK